MKTREIEIMVTPSILEYELGSFIVTKDPVIINNFNQGKLESQKLIKAKLIIEIPEREITITESEFDKLIGKIDSETDWLFIPRLGNAIKEKLFTE
jgi:hypothetical protein